MFFLLPSPPHCSVSAQESSVQPVLSWLLLLLAWHLQMWLRSFCDHQSWWISWKPHQKSHERTRHVEKHSPPWMALRNPPWAVSNFQPLEKEWNNEVKRSLMQCCTRISDFSPVWPNRRWKKERKNRFQLPRKAMINGLFSAGFGWVQKLPKEHYSKRKMSIGVGIDCRLTLVFFCFFFFFFAFFSPGCSDLLDLFWYECFDTLGDVGIFFTLAHHGRVVRLDVGDAISWCWWGVWDFPYKRKQNLQNTFYYLSLDSNVSCFVNIDFPTYFEQGQTRKRILIMQKNSSIRTVDAR